jgi:hypothetical protein
MAKRLLANRQNTGWHENHLHAKSAVAYVYSRKIMAQETTRRIHQQLG